MEDNAALGALQECAAAARIPLAYDAGAYFVTHSKKRSNSLFDKLGIPQPRSWPECGLPLIAKPSVASGSQGVTMISTQAELDAFIKRVGSQIGQWVLQEYVYGPSYSIEVLGGNGQYIALQVTELEMDEGYDCQRVLAPAGIPPSVEGRIRQMALDIAAGLDLTGIMDLEVIVSEGDVRVLEIDARLPSQTPAAVYQSTGVNMIEMLGEIFVSGAAPAVPDANEPRGVVYEHVRATAEGLKLRGEHIMADAGALKVVPDFFGADTALTDFQPSSLPWAATLIAVAEDKERAWLKRERIIGNIEGYLAGDCGDAPSPCGG